MDSPIPTWIWLLAPPTHRAFWKLTSPQFPHLHLKRVGTWTTSARWAEKASETTKFKGLVFSQKDVQKALMKETGASLLHGNGTPSVGPGAKGPRKSSHSREPTGTSKGEYQCGRGGCGVRWDRAPASPTQDKPRDLSGPLLLCLRSGARNAGLLGRLCGLGIKRQHTRAPHAGPGGRWPCSLCLPCCLVQSSSSARPSRRRPDAFAVRRCLSSVSGEGRTLGPRDAERGECERTGSQTGFPETEHILKLFSGYGISQTLPADHWPGKRRGF